MGIRVSLEMRGMEEYLQRIAAAGNSIESACAEAVVESAKPIYQDIKAWANKHKETGAVAAGVIEPKAETEGNFVYAEVGISGEGESWHAVFTEYGRPGVPADPGIRAAIEKNKPKVNKIRRDVLRKRGIPIE